MKLFGYEIRNQASVQDPGPPEALNVTTPEVITSLPEAFKHLPEVAAAVMFRATALARVPLVGDDSSVMFALRNASQLLMALEWDLLLYGRAYWEVMTAPLRIRSIQASQVTNPQHYGDSYRVSDSRLVAPENMLHFSERLVRDEKTGKITDLNPATTLLESARLAYWSTKSNADASKAKTNVARYIAGYRSGTSDNDLFPTEELVEAFSLWLKGYRKVEVAQEDGSTRVEYPPATGPFLFPGEPFTAVMGGQGDELYTEVQREFVEKVARTYDVPLVVLKDPTAATGLGSGASSEVAVRVWYKSSLTSRLRQVEQTIQLNTELDSVRFETAEINELGHDPEQVRLDVQAGILTAEEGKALLYPDGVV